MLSSLTKTYSTILFCCVLLLPIVSLAHSTTQSSTVLVEDAEGKWTLQIRGALAAFKSVVQTEYSEEAYRTPKEFENLVFQLIEQKVKLSIDGNAISIKDGHIRLGHEAIIVYHIEAPSEFGKVAIKNTLFKSIFNSKNTFLVLKSGVKKKMFALNKTSKYSAHIAIKNNEFVLINETKNEASFSMHWVVLCLFTAFFGLIGLVKNFKA